MKKILCIVTALAIVAGACSPAPGKKAMVLGSAGNDSVAHVRFNNTSGRALVVALVQGTAGKQTANQVAWLRKDPASTYYWMVPAVPASNADLLPYIFDLPAGDTLNIAVPQYAAAVGFRCLVSDPAYKQNALQVLNVSSTQQVNYMSFPNEQTATYVFDKFEAGLTTNTPGIWNITAVDFLGLPMQLSMEHDTVGFKDGVTATGLQQKLSQLASPYSTGGTIAPNTATTTYRFFSPSHISMGAALDLAIDSTVINLPHFTDSVMYGNYTFFNFSATSVTSGGLVTATIGCSYLNITQPGAARPISVNDVTTANSFSGEIIGGTNPNVNDSLAQVELGAILSAAICRGVGGYPHKWGDIVHTATNCSAPWNYYKQSQQYNLYSALIHSYSIHNKNYGFPYDDFFGDEAGFTAVAGDKINVTILPYSGTFTATPNPPTVPQTGCLVVTVPADTIYPNGTAWQIGKVKAGTNMIQPGANQLCQLQSDTVTCTFPSSPTYKMKIWMQGTTVANSVFFYESGVLKPGMNITGLYYNPQQRILTFGQAAAWVGQ